MKPRPACPQGHAYTEANTYRTPGGYRRCVTCRADREAGRMADFDQRRTKVNADRYAAKLVAAKPKRSDHGRPHTYKTCHCDYCRASVTFSPPMNDRRVAVECWCRDRMMLVTTQVIADGRTISCGLSTCKQLEQDFYGKRAA